MTTPTSDATRLLPLGKLTLHDSCRARAALCPVAIARYAELLKDGAEFPAVVAYLPPVTAFSDGSAFYLSDGWLRYHAHRQAGRSHIEVAVRPGGLKEARLHAASCNWMHGQPRTNADKRRAVLLVLEDEEARKWSNARIAAHCGGMSPPFVAAMRRVFETSREMERLQAEARGKQMMNLSGQKPAAGEEAAGFEPEAVCVAVAEEEDVTAAQADEDAVLELAQTKERWVRSLRKLDRFSALLGRSTEELIAEYRAVQAELAKAAEARQSLEQYRGKKSPESPWNPFDEG